MPTVYDPITSSSYLDFTGYRITNQPDVESAYGISSSNVTVATSASINVAIVLDRVQDPTALLAENWAERQQTLAQLNNTGALWTTYGADQNQFTAIEQSLASNFHLTVLDGTNSNYVTSAQSRTIWVELNSAADFNNLFNTTLYQYTDPHHAGNDFVFWNGNLSLPQGWNVQGLWFDTESVPLASNYTPGVSVTLAQGYQGVGNGSSLQPGLAAQDIAALYNFPLQGLGVQTGMVGLVEPGIGSALPSGQTQTFQQLLTAYLAHVGENGSGTVYVQGANGQLYAGGDAGERSLDVGVVSAINPNSNIGLYNGSGNNGNADASTFTALQSAIWDTLNNPGVISNSFGDDQSMTPGSPFYAAYAQLFIDAALRNQTVFTALGDGGSGNETANGLTNLEYNVTSPYTVLVGGTSISSFTSAQQDPTINTSIVASALAGNLPTIWQLVEGGLTSLPADAAQLQTFVETVWNQYFVQGAHITGGGYQANWTSSGGVDPTQSTPSYQVDYGLSPVTADPLAQPGRGAPDVAADAGGNTNYVVPNSDMVGTSLSGGTSAASPLWASLTVQLNTIFHDQGLPNLGYMNDLLYIAAVIAPASFNDVTLGTNTSSFVLGGPYESGGHAVTPTGFGFNAGPGYDYASGLGTPNGLQLARTLTDIAHSEMWFGAIPDVIDSNGAGGWTSGADQSLLFQTTSDAVTQVGVHTGPDAFGFFSAASGSFAWTSQLAEQSLQPGFDPNLVILFDKQGQGSLAQAHFSSGEALAVSINTSSAQAIQASLSSPFGFADFSSSAGDVRVARPVAIAETADGANDQTAVVRLRQDGQDSTSITFYRVDDLNGTINGLHPEDPGYQAALQSRAYQMTSGGTSIGGPGYGNYEQTGLQHVNAGDLIAMQFTNDTHGNTYLGFA
ncbi:MAG TPA: S53 family peptidase, partial [Reyranella sp.]